jgi:multiple sugar transport system permease protein
MFGMLLLYPLVGAAIVLFGLSAKLRSAKHAASVAVSILLGICVAALKWSHDPGPALFIGTVLTGLLFLGLYRFLFKPKMAWQQYRDAKALRRQAILHLILTTGSLLFLMPFIWLVTTSLKEDEDMSKFPPVWIPQQQVKINLDGKEVGLAYAPYNGRRVKVAVLEEKETGGRVLRILEPASLAGKEFEIPRAQVTKIKTFAPVWKNYPDALKFLPDETILGLVFLENTLVLTGFTILGTLLSSSLVAFAFARLRWPGRDLLFVILLGTMMVPKAVTMMPAFLIFRQLGWIDTLKPLWVPAFFGNALYIFLLRQFFLTIPNDLEEAARIDGCSYFGIYWRIMIPLIKPALAAITIMTFMASWNDFMNPLIYVSSPLRMPLAYALALFQTAHGGEPGLLMAAATMMMIPVLALFFFTQRYFIQGITLTGIKG